MPAQSLLWDRHVRDGLPGPLAICVFPAIRRALREAAGRWHLQLVIEVMPHVWSSLVMPVLRTLGVRYATIVHDDAAGHHGDWRGYANRLLLMAARRAGCRHRAERDRGESLRKDRGIDPARIRVVPLPDIDFGVRARDLPYDGTRPLRLLFLGRILLTRGSTFSWVPPSVSRQKVLRSPSP